ncbi:MAG TPA: type III pantothenate kinase [Usitatibacter sp.]|nr:type III pantothenate kinase [Usitatibacter sp.]
MASNSLLVDAGNTRIKWGIHDGRAWVTRDAVATADVRSLSDAWTPSFVARHALASNVAGTGVQAELEQLCAAARVPLRFIRSEARQLGVVNGYSDPGQLGSDRWAALIAAHHAERGHKLVVNAGTALTVDAITDDGHFLGGLIVPGPALMRRSLDRGTAGLRLTEGVFRHFPASTPDAITSGAIQAAAGAIERMCGAMARRGVAAGRIVLSGGAAPEIAGHLSLPHAIHENLVLDGLALIARAP